MTHAGGRPLLFKTVQELEKKIQAYFDLCKTNEDIPSVCGLAVELDCDRETLSNYEKRDKYFGTVKRAKTRITAIQEQMALKGKLNPTVWIFSAKNNLGYTDKQEIEQSGTTTQIIVSSHKDKKALEDDYS